MEKVYQQLVEEITPYIYGLGVEELTKLGLINTWGNELGGISCVHEALSSLSEAFNIDHEKLAEYRNKEYRFFDVEANEEKVYDYFNPHSGWLHYALIKGIGRKYGINGKWENTPQKELLNKIFKYLQKRFYVAVSLKPEFWNNENNLGHIVLIKAINGNKDNLTITINDPNSYGGEIQVPFQNFIKYYNNNLIVFCKNEDIGHDMQMMNEMLTCSPLVATTIENGDGPIFIHVHEQEILSREIAINGVQTFGGKLVYLTQNNERWLRYSANGQALRIDPNRIFSEKGLEETVDQRNSHLDPKNLLKAISLGIRIRNYILAKIGDGGGPVIAMHNNTMLDINKYIGKTKHVYINLEFPINCFVITNSLEHFDRLRQLDTPVVYIDYSDEGSLYNYFKIRGRDYFNVEAGYNDKQWQEKMLNCILHILY